MGPIPGTGIMRADSDLHPVLRSYDGQTATPARPHPLLRRPARSPAGNLRVVLAYGGTGNPGFARSAWIGLHDRRCPATAVLHEVRRTQFRLSGQRLTTGVDGGASIVRLARGCLLRWVGPWGGAPLPEIRARGAGRLHCVESKAIIYNVQELPGSPRRQFCGSAAAQGPELRQAKTE